MGGILSQRKETKSKPKTPPKGGSITPLDRAILDLKNSRDRLTKYRSKLETDSAKLAARAKLLHSEGKTSYALHLLRLRKYKSQEADRVEEQLLTVLRMVDKISEKHNEQEVVQAMRRGKDALQMLHDQMGIEDVLDLMDEIRDQDEVERRINEVLGEGGLRMVEEMGEDDILMELEELEKEVWGAKGEEESWPAVPTKPLPKVKEAKVEEIETATAAVPS